jgi:hypothetical protein
MPVHELDALGQEVYDRSLAIIRAAIADAVTAERERILSALRGKTVLMQPASGPEVAAVPFAAVLDVLRGDDAST